MKPVPVNLPSLCAQRVGPEFAVRIVGVGETALLMVTLLGLLAFRECTGHILLETLGCVPERVKARGVIVSGFHSPLEQQVLRSVLRRKGGVVKVLARNRLVHNLATDIVAPHVADGSALATLLSERLPKLSVV